jgi:hypothetical protein
VKADRTLFYGRADTPCVYMEGYGWLGLRAAEALADELRAAAVEARTLDLGRTKKGVEP